MGEDVAPQNPPWCFPKASKEGEVAAQLTAPTVRLHNFCGEEEKGARSKEEINYTKNDVADPVGDLHIRSSMLSAPATLSMAPCCTCADGPLMS